MKRIWDDLRGFVSAIRSRIKWKHHGESSARVPGNRVQFDLAPGSMDRLNALRSITEAASHAEVVKNALRLYEALIEETANGKEFFVRDEKGQMSPYQLFL